MALVSIAIASLVTANMSFTRANGVGMDMATAEFMIEQIRELMVMTDYDDLHDYDDVTYSPPIDAEGTALSDFADFTQQITVQNVSANDLEQAVADDSTSFIRVTVEIISDNELISSSSWIRTQY